MASEELLDEPDEPGGVCCKSAASRHFMSSKIQWHLGSKSALMRCILFPSMAAGSKLQQAALSHSVFQPSPHAEQSLPHFQSVARAGSKKKLG